MANLIYSLCNNKREFKFNRDCLAGCAIRWDPNESIDVTNFQWKLCGSVPEHHRAVIQYKAEQLLEYLFDTTWFPKDSVKKDGQFIELSTDLPSVDFFMALKIIRIPIKNLSYFTSDVTNVVEDLLHPLVTHYWSFPYPLNMFVLDCVMKGSMREWCRLSDKQADEPYRTRGTYGSVFDPLFNYFYMDSFASYLITPAPKLGMELKSLLKKGHEFYTKQSPGMHRTYMLHSLKGILEYNPLHMFITKHILNKEVK